MGLISEVMGGIIGSDIDLGNLYNNIGTTGQLAQGAAGQLASQLPGMTQFQPFTVTSGTSQVGMTPQGGFNINLSEGAQAQQNALRQQANYYMTQPVQGANQTNLASNQAFNLANDPNRVAMAGANAYQGYTGLQNQAGDLASQFLGTGPTGALASQGAGLQALQSGMGQMNQVPAGTYQTRDAASGAFGAGQGFLGASQTQAGDLNQLRGQFANQVGGQLGQQPSASIGQLGQQALGLGSQGLATQAPSDVEALRSQYAGLAGQAAGNVLGSTAGRETDVYNRIRATQRPEEERQRMALEEILFNQGRSGVSTNMYGGTPEQLAMARAQGKHRTMLLWQRYSRLRQNVSNP